MTRILYFSNSGLGGKVFEILRKRFFDVEVAKAEKCKKPETFLNSINQIRPDLILADYHNNYTESLKKYLSSIKEQIPLILLTEVENEHLVLPLIESGVAYDFLYSDRLNKLPAIIKKTLHCKIAEQEIKENNRKYKAIFENSLDGILLTVTDGRILAANAAACSIFQMTEEEICAAGRKGLVDINHPNYLKSLQERRLTGRLKTELMMKRKDGSSFPAEITSSVFNSGDGQNRTSMIIRDISDAKKAEEELRTSKEKYKQLFKNSPLPCFIYDLENYEIQEVNLAATKIYGYKRQELLNLTLLDLLPDNEAVKHLNTLQDEDQKDGEVFQHRMVHLKKGRSPLTVETYQYSLEYKNRKCRLIMCLDISEKENYLRRLKSKTSKLQIAQKIAKLGYWENDLSNEKLYWSEEVYNIWNQPRKDFNPTLQFIKDTIHPEDKNKFEESHKLALKGIKDFDIEYRIILPDGTLKWVHEIGRLSSNLFKNITFSGSIQDITDRIKTEKSLQESNTRYELVLRATSEVIYDWDCITDEFFWSEEYSKIFGYDKKHMASDIDAWSRNVHPDDSHVVDYLYEVLEGKDENFQAEYRFKRVDGQYLYVVERGTVVRNDDGKAIRMVGAIKDVTAKKIALLQLEKSKSWYKSLIQSQTNYMIRIDLQGRYSYANKKFKDEFGGLYPDGKILGKDSMVSVMPYHYDRVKEITEKCLANPNQVFQMEIDKPSKNGGVKTTIWDMIFLENTDKENGEIQCVGIDITDRVKAEAENHFQANLLSKIGQAVIATDVEGKVVYWNKAATEMYGWTTEEVLGVHIEKFLPQLSKKKISLNYSKQGLKESHSELTLNTKKGDVIDIFLTSSPVYNERGKLTGFIGISNDITERIKADKALRELNRDLKKYTEELITANKGLEQFSYIVSHNLRAPVANIIGLGDLMNEDYPDEIKNDFKNKMLDNVKRLDSIIRDLNDILQIKVETSAKKEPVELEELVNSIKSAIGEIIQKENIEIITDFKDVPALNAIRTYLYSVFYNLIFNSIKYRQNHNTPVIQIKSLQKKGRVILTFEDNGIGIDLKKRGNEIFGLYKKFHHHVEGKGMGLFMVKNQVELMGGKITVSSEVGQGTVFTIELEEEKTIKNLDDEETTTIYYN
ncbi:PAS domain S-box protein [Gramella sp. KN1008]|uniref:PAS domain S-box protein n=1 Tax=Gramella sp. KN1008 TaxID=2529298 RepID=UPI00103A7EBA|nr:PAS domain S-box protein [Gramella sp. KN1008]TBW29272.1 PAS domain S-box protein [Gramella sp. KN1008]